MEVYILSHNFRCQPVGVLAESRQQVRGGEYYHDGQANVRQLCGETLKGAECFGYETHRVYVLSLRQEANLLCGGGQTSTGQMSAQAGR